MDIHLMLKIIFYGIIEGITEWLPISSTGHMIIASGFIPLNVTDRFFDLFLIVIQLGAIMAVVVNYRKKICPPFLQSAKKEITTGAWLMFWLNIGIATLPAAITGFFLDDLIEHYFFTPFMVALMLIIYGICFILAEIKNRKDDPQINTTASGHCESHINFKTAFLIGLFQTLALIPGTSRSGATILGAILLGIPRPEAAEFSFFMAIPVMFGASILKICKAGLSFSPREYAMLLIGMSTAFIISMLTIRWLIRLVRKHTFIGFGIYRIIFGSILLVIQGTFL